MSSTSPKICDWTSKSLLKRCFGASDDMGKMGESDKFKQDNTSVDRYGVGMSMSYLNSGWEPGKRNRQVFEPSGQWEIEIDNFFGSGVEGKGGPLDGYGELEREVEETVKVGESVGIVMTGFNNQIRKMVQGEKEASSSR
ncbi:hypothetical protein L1987_30784 [Smallanthus sonchifolius]|uniref:Uncharacterized protein n=1 Tax=Smallanthus sonchifolius TaxID=185202 RepID=A0ACB9I357_9ASTR|nr:hypothetical protein L1987_30784 [Smallanthus sonchifolius]